MCRTEACVFILSIYAVYVFAYLFSIALRKYIWHAALLKKLKSKTTNSSVCCVIFKELICSFFSSVTEMNILAIAKFVPRLGWSIESKTLELLK